MKNIDSAQNYKTPAGLQNPGPAVNVSQNGFNQPPQTRPKPKKNRVLKLLAAFMALAIIFLGTAAVLRAFNISQKIFVGRTFTFWGQVKQLVSGDDQKLIGEDSGQINILLLGIGGEGHEGPYLTDTMIVAQIRPGQNSVSLVSIPRDYRIDMSAMKGPNGALNYGKQKINAAFALGLGKNLDYATGAAWARQEAEKVSGLKIPYFAVVDFSGFEKAIDEVGGVDVIVDKTFTDAEYPNETYGYLPPQTFTAGPRHMDGKTGLVFARSRHGSNGEGSDFARGKRQKKILEALKQKVLSLNLISNSGTLNQLLDVFASHFVTNLTPSEIFHLYKLNKDGHLSTVVASSLDPSTGIVCDGKDPDDGAYIIFPCEGKTSDDLSAFFKNSFTSGRVAEEKPTIWLGNSTDDPAIYARAEKQLTDAGATVLQVGYSKDFLSQTIFYAANSKPATAQFLKDNFNAAEVSYPPKNMALDKSKVDIVIILGEKNK